MLIGFLFRKCLFSLFSSVRLIGVVE